MGAGDPGGRALADEFREEPQPFMELRERLVAAVCLWSVGSPGRVAGARRKNSRVRTPSGPGRAVRATARRSGGRDAGRAVATGRPRRQRGPVPVVRLHSARSGAAEQAFRASLAQLLAYRRWAARPAEP